jgi:hypothetical protein
VIRSMRLVAGRGGEGLVGVRGGMGCGGCAGNRSGVSDGDRHGDGGWDARGYV